MYIKQLSVFLENREGRLEEVTETISNNKINIASVSLADTSEYGMLRMVVSEPEKAKQILKEAGFSAMLTDVVAVKLPHDMGMLNKLLKVLMTVQVGIEYMYALSTGENASIVLKLSDMNLGIQALKENNFEFFKAEDAYKVNGCEN